MMLGLNLGLVGLIVGLKEILTDPMEEQPVGTMDGENIDRTSSLCQIGLPVDHSKGVL